MVGTVEIDVVITLLGGPFCTRMTAIVARRT